MPKPVNYLIIRGLPLSTKIRFDILKAEHQLTSRQALSYLLDLYERMEKSGRGGEEKPRKEVNLQ